MTPLDTNKSTPPTWSTLQEKEILKLNQEVIRQIAAAKREGDVVKELQLVRAKRVLHKIPLQQVEVTELYKEIFNP